MRTPLQPNENILLRTQTTWIVLIWPAFIALVALTFGIWLGDVKWAAVVILPALGFFGWKYLEWQHNIWVITNFRVIDEFGIFNINTRESPLDKINNVSYSQTIWGRILNFGNVEIQTAATIGETVYPDVHAPKRLKDTITHAQSQYNHNRMNSHIKDIVQQMQPQPVQVSQPSHTYVAPPPVLPESKTSPSTSQSQGLGSELEKLFELKQKGILTEEEYQRAKRKILG